VPDRIKSFTKMNGGQNSSVWRFFLLEAVQLDWDRRRTYSIVDLPGRQPAWVGEIRFLDSR